jgi:hypothetical protein
MEDIGATQEVAMSYAAGTADQAYGGLAINLVPREGGNTFTGSLFATGTRSSFQGNNLTPALVSQGLLAVNSIQSNYDINPSGGGPLKRDKLWFYAGARFVANNNYVGGRFYNANAGNPNAWTYVADPSRQETDNLSQKSGEGRVTWQATSRNKFSFYYDDQGRCWCNYSASGLYSPEAMPHLEFPTNRMFVAGWTSPVTSRLLVELRGSFRDEVYSYLPAQPDGSPNPDLIQVTEQSTGILYRSGMGFTSTLPFQTTGAKVWQSSAAVSYVTGSHAFKFGFTDVSIQRHSVVAGNSFDVTYRFNNGIPNQITEIAAPYSHDEDQKAELGLYAQDKWTDKRLTLNYGVRFDYFDSYYPQQALGSAVLVPNRNIVIPQTPGLDFKDITPRLGATYDLFGNGKTALKATVNKYVQAVGIATAIGSVFGEADNPAVRLANTVTRSWTPTGAAATNPNYYVPQCSLINPLVNGNCGAMSNVNFGNATPATTYDPAITTGWGSRPYQWEFSTGVQQALTSRMSLNVAYFRKIFGNFLVTDNTLVTPSDYSPFGITAPVDPRLPGGGGYAVSGLYDLNPNRVGLVNNLITFASNFGNQTQHWNGIDITVNGRFGKGVLLQGGMSTGRTSTDNCDVVAKVNNPSPLYCHQDTPFFLPQVKLLGAYTIPKVEIAVSAVYQSIPGPQIAANDNVPNALIAPVLGRNLSGGAANATVNLVAPGAMYGQRSNELDFRVGRKLTFSHIHAAVNFDLYNVTNTNAVLTLNNNYAAWLTPLSTLQPRVGKFSVLFDF